MADHVWPEDEGTGGYIPGSGDPDDAANFAYAYDAIEPSEYVREGMVLDVPNWTTPSLTITSGKALVHADTALATQSGETRNGVKYGCSTDQRTGLTLTAQDENHVFLQLDLSTDDTVNFIINTTGAEPGDPSMKIGIVDTVNNKIKYPNRGKSMTPESFRLERPATLTNGTDVTNLTFTLQNTWRDVLPGESLTKNTIPLYHRSFDESMFLEQTNLISTYQISGTEMPTSLAEGAMTVDNTTGSFSSQAYGTRVTPKAPFFSVIARCESLTGTVGTGGNASDISVGIYKDANNFIVGGMNTSNNWMEAFWKINGVNTTNNFNANGSTIPSRPFDIQCMFMGDRMALLTRELNKGWRFHGSVTLPATYDLYDKSEWDTWEVIFRFACAPTKAVTISDFRVMQTMGFGIRDPIPMTYKDGAPLIKDGKLYLTATAGSVDHRGFQQVVRLDLTTYEFELAGVLFCEASSGYISNYVASHVMYDQDRDTFFILWSGFGNGPSDPSPNQKVWVTKTRQNVLSGVHYLPAELSNLPVGATGKQHDAMVFYDEGASAWRCIHNYDAIDEVAVSETTDDDLTSGWTLLNSYRDAVNQIEGGKFTRVNGETVMSYADPSATDLMVTADYPNPALNRTAITTDFAPLDDAPHPTIVPVPEDGQTRYLLISMDESKIYGLGESSHGAFYVYEADQRADGYEYPVREFYRG